MDIGMALSRVKEIKDQTGKITEHLKYIDIGYTTDTQKNYRVRFDLPEAIKNENPESDNLPVSHNINIRLDELIVKKMLEKELNELNAELEILSPVIEAANDMLREATVRQSLNDGVSRATTG